MSAKSATMLGPSASRSACRPFGAMPRRADAGVKRAVSAIVRARAPASGRRQSEEDLQPSTSASAQQQQALCGSLWLKAMLPPAGAVAQPAAAATLVLLGLALTADGALAATDGGAGAAALDAAAAALGQQQHGGMPLAELGEQDFWGNIARYGRYFVTVMLGTGYVMVRPFQALLKKPVTAVLAIGALVALVFGVRVALEYMLGLEEYGYSPSGTYNQSTEYGI